MYVRLTAELAVEPPEVSLFSGLLRVRAVKDGLARGDLAQLETVDFLVVPFNNAPSLAHTMLSFGFRNGQHLGVSVEARLEEGESY